MVILERPMRRDLQHATLFCWVPPLDLRCRVTYLSYADFQLWKGAKLWLLNMRGYVVVQLDPRKKRIDDWY